MIEYIEYFKDHSYLSNVKLGKVFGVDEATIRRWNRKYGLRRVRIPRDIVEDYKVTLDSPVRLKLKDCAIFADIHSPLYDADLLNQALDDCDYLGIKDLIIPGDVLNGDELSQYQPKQESARWEVEKKHSVALLNTFGENFDEITYLWGNHDNRVLKGLYGYGCSFSEAMQAVYADCRTEVKDKVNFSNLDHCWLELPTGLWYVCHPASFSTQPLTVARKLAAKFHCNIMTAHSHHFAWGYDVSGKYQVAEAGGFFDVDKTAYLQRSTTYGQWKQGYFLFKDGMLIPRGQGLYFDRKERKV